MAVTGDQVTSPLNARTFFLVFSLILVMLSASFSDFQYFVFIKLSMHSSNNEHDYEFDVPKFLLFFLFFLLSLLTLNSRYLSRFTLSCRRQNNSLFSLFIYDDWVWFSGLNWMICLHLKKSYLFLFVQILVCGFWFVYISLVCVVGPLAKY